jgi:hypothetical protein
METQVEILRRLERAERRFRAMCGLTVVVVVGAVLLEVRAPVAAEQAGGLPALAARVAVVEAKLSPVALVPGPCAEVVFSGVNVRIVNGLGSTETKNGCGNLIVGYNELRSRNEAGESLNLRSGSHNVIVGRRNNYSSYGGLVVGNSNDIYGAYSGVTAGVSNAASGDGSSVSGGYLGTASGAYSSVSAGQANTASGMMSSVSGGWNGTASGALSSVSGGNINTASGAYSSVSGGQLNTASGELSSVSGGNDVTQLSDFGWSAGSHGGFYYFGNFRSP